MPFPCPPSEVLRKPGPNFLFHLFKMRRRKGRNTYLKGSSIKIIFRVKYNVRGI